MGIIGPARAWIIDPLRGDLLTVFRGGRRGKCWVLVLNESLDGLPDVVTLPTREEILAALKQHEVELRVEDGVPTGVRIVGTESFIRCQPW